MTEDYKTHPALNQSSLKAFAADPWAYWLRGQGKLPPPTETKEMEFGRNLEAYLRGDLDRRIITIPDSVLTSNGQRRGKQWDSWKRSQPADAKLMRAVEIESEIGSFQKCAEEIRAHELARKLILGRNGRWNMPLYWQMLYDFGQVDCKAELDRWFDIGVAVDLKTCRDVSPGGFSMQAEQFGYAIQQAWYTLGLGYCGLDLQAFYFVAVCNQPPHAVEVYELDEAWVRDAQLWIDRWLERWWHAKQSGQYRPPTWGRVNVIDRPKRGLWREEAEERWWNQEEEAVGNA